MQKRKKEVEILLVDADFSAIPGRRILKSRHLVCVDLIWPRKGIARKSAAREAVFRKGCACFTSEEWAKRILFREEIDTRAAFAVSITETVTEQKLKRFARLTAKYALRMGADFMEKAMVGYADIASAPIDAISAMVGEKDAPKAIAQGVLDFSDLPDDGGEKTVTIPLFRPGRASRAGSMTLAVRG